MNVLIGVQSGGVILCSQGGAARVPKTLCADSRYAKSDGWDGLSAPGPAMDYVARVCSVHTIRASIHVCFMYSSPLVHGAKASAPPEVGWPTSHNFPGAAATQ